MFAAASPSYAAKANIFGGPSTYRFESEPGAYNDVRIGFSAGKYVVEDRGVSEIVINSGSACSRGATLKIVLCPGVGGVAPV